MRALFLICFIGCVRIAAAQDFLQFSYGVKDGLVDSHVRSIMQDSRGFMWFGTNEGLSRFDGMNFKNYLSFPDSASLPSNYITQIVETKPGHLAMVVGIECKLVAMNTFTGQFYFPDDFSFRQACGIYKLSPSRYLVSSTDSCFIVNEELRIVDALVFPKQNNSKTTFVAELDQQTYLVVSNENHHNKFNFFNPLTKTFNGVSVSLKTKSDQYPTFSFYDKTHQWLYFADYFTGIYRYSLDGTQLKHWPMVGYSSVHQISDSTLWLGGSVEDRGALLLNLKDSKIIPVAINGSKLFDAHMLFTDRQGNHWVGTEQGVTKLVVDKKIIKSWSSFPEQPQKGYYPLNVLKGKDEQYYLSFFTNASVYKLDQKKDTWNIFSKDLITGPWYFNNVGDHIVFTGGQTMRFTTFDPVAGRFSHASDFFKKYFPNADVLILAFQHSNGDRWYSANKGGGLVRIGAKDGAIHHYTKNGPRGTFTNSYYATYAEDHSGNVWFAVNKTKTLLRWDKDQDWFSEVTLDTVPGMKGLSFRGINKIVNDKQNNLWIGFDGSGLVQYDHQHNRAKHFGIKQGLPSDYITALCFDSNDRLWIETHKGLSCLTPSKNKVQTFTKENGLVEDNFIEGFIFYDKSSNQLWLGSTSSVMRFDPDKLLGEASFTANVYLDELYINGKARELQREGTMHLLQNENNIQFRFVAVNANKKPVQFRYQLKGHDPEWIESASGTTASYSNLEPGNYEFVVSAYSRGEDQVSFRSTPFSFIVATPFFKARWFKISSIIAIALSMMLIVRAYYTRKGEKERFVLERDHAIEKERTRIASDMHDDFGANLSRIKFISEKIKLNPQLNIDLNFELTKISTYSDQMAEKMNEIVWALNQRYDTINDLVSFSRSYAADYLSQNDIKLVFQTNDNPELKISGEVRRNIFLVIKEALHNTVKHACATQVDIIIELSQHLKVTISDNGKGVNLKQVRPFANGLVNMKKRIEDIGGEFKMENATIGTSIKIKVPL
jgi:signal transduction histidine kinase/ligand-binding sensor domain-containing protein